MQTPFAIHAPWNTQTQNPKPPPLHQAKKETPKPTPTLNHDFSNKTRNNPVWFVQNQPLPFDKQQEILTALRDHPLVAVRS